jgi:uncharacterized protein YheU (UPF0270 family)
VLAFPGDADKIGARSAPNRAGEQRLDDWTEQDEPPPPVAIPHTDLSAEALRGVVESFVLREGTDYGSREVSLETKVAEVMGQLERGEARIMFDPGSASITIVLLPQRERRGR